MVPIKYPHLMPNHSHWDLLLGHIAFFHPPLLSPGPVRSLCWGDVLAWNGRIRLESYSNFQIAPKMKECMSAWSSIECVNQYRINKHSDHLLGTLVHLRHCAWPLLGIWKTQLCSPSSSSLSSYSIFPKLRIQWFCNFVFSLNKYLQSNSCVLGMVLYSEDKPPNKTD